jgi:hypothetical protein
MIQIFVKVVTGSLMHAAIAGIATAGCPGPEVTSTSRLLSPGRDGHEIRWGDGFSDRGQRKTAPLDRTVAREGLLNRLPQSLRDRSCRACSTADGLNGFAVVPLGAGL